MRLICALFISILLSTCQQPTATTQQKKDTNPGKTITTDVSLIILGTVQDGGSPHIGCKKPCCQDLFKNPDHSRKVVSLGIIDKINKQTYLFEATPDLPSQIKTLKETAGFKNTETPNGIFLTHAHIGHYTGLMYLGKEAMNSKEVPVYTMPVMQKFLTTNGPWSQLVENKNIVFQSLENEQPVELNNQIKVEPFTVPHRDEYSETVGYKISGPNKKVLFIPDIDKWQKWNKNILQEIQLVDYAFLDATFYDAEEINNRDISQIPHPFIIESMDLFGGMNETEKNKIYFIHFNHTNPALNLEHEKSKVILENGFHIAQFGEVLEL